MSNLIFDYLNQEIKLSKTIINIEKDFSNGYYFAELLQKIGCLKSDLNKYKKEAKTEEEIKINFTNLKQELSNIGIHLDEELINLIIKCHKNSAANLLYKIKTKMTRKNINFDEIMNKIKLSNKKLEEMKNRNQKFMKSSLNFFRRQSKLLLKSKSSSHFSDFSGLTNYQIPSKMNSQAGSLISSSRDNRNYLSKNDLIEEYLSNKDNSINTPNKKIKLKPLPKNKNNKIIFPIKREEKKNNFNKNRINILSKKSKNIKEITEELSQNVNNINRTRNKKNENLENESSIKIVNNQMNRTTNEFMHFSSFENNSFKVGLNIQVIDSKVRKFAEHNNPDLIRTNIIQNKLKQKLEEYKVIVDKKTQKEKDLEEALKNSHLKNIEKPSVLKIDKQFYKMGQYEKERKKKFPLKTKEYLEEIKKSRQLKSTFNLFYDNNDILENNWYKTGYMSNFTNLRKNLSLSPNDYINNLNKKEIKETKKLNELKRKRIDDDYYDIEDIVNLIIDITDEAYRYQNETKKEFINLPEYNNWIELFIEGKTCIKNNEMIMNLMRKEEDEEEEEENENTNTNKKRKKRKKTNKDNLNEAKKDKLKNEIINSEYCKNEFMDYTYNRGYWNSELYIPNNYYGSQLHIYQVLGDDLTKIIASAKILFQGMIQINFNKMKNEEFELKEEEKENIIIPQNNKRNQLFGEIIELNYDNNKNNNMNMSSTINDTTSLINDNTSLINKEKLDLSYIPIKLCLIGTTYSGRKTQANLLHEKYPELKIYSLPDIIKSYTEEYERLYINIDKEAENNVNKNKSIKKKKDKDDLMKEFEEDKKRFEKVKELIEEYALKKENDLSDDTKIKLLINEIQKDFPYKSEKEVIEEINKNNERKNEIENEIEKLNNESGKKPKNKIDAQINKLQVELDEINKSNYKGFILIDFPNNINQHIKLEEYLSGFIQEIDRYPDKRDINLNFLTDSIDKPYNNISFLCKDNYNYITAEKPTYKSIFNKYIFLNIDENIIKERIDKEIEEIKEKNEIQNKNKKGEKKVEEELEFPNIDIIIEDLKKYSLEIPKIFDFLGNFKNLEIINQKDKNEINDKIDKEIINIVNYFEGKINKNNNLDFSSIDFPDDNYNIKYFKRLNEVKKIMKNEGSNNIILSWIENKNKYVFSVKEFIYNVQKLKQDIIKKMNSIQEDFIKYLNMESDKKNIINLFIKKYDVFMNNFSSIKNNLLVKEETEKDIIELTEKLWAIIQLRKKKAIDELNIIRNKRFIAIKLENFSEMISNLFYSEAENYLNKVNIIQQFYYELENKNNNNKKPEYKLKKSELTKKTNNLEIYVPPPQKEVKKKKIKPRLKRYEDDQKEYLISPKIDRLYKNCFKLLFNYEKKLKEEGFKSYEKEEYDFIKRRRNKRFDFKRESMISVNSDKKIFNPDIEMKTALTNEKVKYKLRLVFLKFFGEKFVEKLSEIEKMTFENMDKWIIQSVDAQNNTMNYIINKIKETVLKPSFKEINNIISKEELDIFNIYEKIPTKFNEFNISNYKSIKEEDKEFDLKELYKVYLDLKLYEIQDNYVTLDSLIDILFKKHIFDSNTKGLMKCFKELPYHYFHKLIQRFKIKTSKEQILIRIDRLFTILCLFNETIPTQEQIENMIKQSKLLLKYNHYLSKDDFLKLKFWFDVKEQKEKKEERKEQKKEVIDANKEKKAWKRRTSRFNTNKVSFNLIKLRLNHIKKEESHKNSNTFQKTIKKMMSFKKDNSNSEGSINESLLNNQDAKKDLKETLFSINKNYNDDINIFEFLDNVSLKFTSKLKRKVTIKVKHKESSNSIINQDEKNKTNKNENELKFGNNKNHTYFEHLVIN